MQQPGYFEFAKVPPERIKCKEAVSKVFFNHKAHKGLRKEHKDKKLDLSSLRT
jgi:hypothetical protein